MVNSVQWNYYLKTKGFMKASCSCSNAPPVAQRQQPPNWKKSATVEGLIWEGTNVRKYISLSNHIFLKKDNLYLKLYTYCSISHASHACQAPLAGWIPNLEEDMLSLPFTSKRLAFLRVGVSLPYPPLIASFPSPPCVWTNIGLGPVIE